MSVSGSESRNWLQNKKEFALGHILENVSPADGKKGAVIAAKSTVLPNYHYHWVRDAGLVMDAVVSMYAQSNESSMQHQASLALQHYLAFSTYIQDKPALTGLGEPKFMVSGEPFNGPWGRPQNDSPALRAISFIHWANVLMREGKIDYVKEKLYSSRMPATSVIKKDLEYISHHWQEPSYDLWEEVKGQHFYTLMVIRKALKEGSQLASKLGDTGAAMWYQKQVVLIEKELNAFWDTRKHYIVATRHYVDGVKYKNSNLDTAVILGLLHGDMGDNFYAWDDAKVLATIQQIIRTFPLAIL